jgi:uncharacterized protein YkwD
MKIILAIMAALASAAETVPTPAPIVTAYEQQLADATNAARVANGAKPLEIDPAMQAYARRHTIEQGRRGMHHGRAPGAENVAAGQRDVPSVMRAWLNSSGHRANMLNRRHTRIAVCGYTIHGQTYWTQCFR